MPGARDQSQREHRGSHGSHGGAGPAGPARSTQPALWHSEPFQPETDRPISRPCTQTSWPGPGCPQHRPPPRLLRTAALRTRRRPCVRSSQDSCTLSGCRCLQFGQHSGCFNLWMCAQPWPLHITPSWSRQASEGTKAGDPWFRSYLPTMRALKGPEHGPLVVGIQSPELPGRRPSGVFTPACCVWVSEPAPQCGARTGVSKDAATAQLSWGCASLAA